MQARQVLRNTLAPLLAAVALATAVVWVADGYLTDQLLTQATARALDQVELGFGSELTAADFETPFSSAKLEELDRRLARLDALVRREGSGILRLNVFARDGTMLYSDLLANRGRVIEPDEAHLLATALAGQPASHSSDLDSPENADLKDRYGSALEVYVPVVVEATVVGAYEIYKERTATWPLRALVWSGSAVFTFLLTFLATRVDAPVRKRLAPTRALSAYPTQAPVTGSPLTAREREVLNLLASSRSYRQIAVDLVVSQETVRTHVKNIMRKLGQSDRTGAVVEGVRTGLLRLQEPE